jgi:hypothetical protein
MIFKLINFEGIKNNPETCTSILCFYHNRRPVPYQVQIKPKTSIILTTCIEEVWKHKLTGEEVKKIKNYVCGK